MDDEKRRFFGGFDGGFCVGFYGKWFDGNAERFGDLSAVLDYLKEQSQKRNDTGAGVLPSFPIGDEEWYVQSHGTGTGVKYRWVLARGGAKIAVHSNPSNNIAPVMVTLGYDAIANRPLEVVMAKIETVLETMGFAIERDLVSRVDIQLTFPLDFAKVQQAYEEKRFVTRVNTHSTHKEGDELQTITWGAGKSRKVEICIYNKTQELLAHMGGVNHKTEDLINFYGNDEDLERLTRVEFRLFRDWLRERNIQSYFDLLADLPQLVRYLTYDYFRALATNKSKGNEHDQKLADWWEEVREGFDLVFGGTFKPIETPTSRKQSAVAFAELFGQALGCMTSAFAKIPFVDKNGERAMTYTEFKLALRDAILRESAEAYKDYCRKREQFRANLEPLDMAFVQERIERKLDARRVREERRKAIETK